MLKCDIEISNTLLVFVIYYHIISRVKLQYNMEGLCDLIRKSTPVCGYCGGFNEKLMKCPCREVFYCGSACQDKHREVHKLQCGAGRKGQRMLRSCANCSNISFSLHSCVCGAVLYCDTECQLQHWGRHRRTCSSWIAVFQQTKTRYRDMSTQTELSCCNILERDRYKGEGAMCIYTNIPSKKDVPHRVQHVYKPISEIDAQDDLPHRRFGAISHPAVQLAETAAAKDAESKKAEGHRITLESFEEKLRTDMIAERRLEIEYLYKEQYLIPIHREEKKKIPIREGQKRFELLSEYNLWVQSVRRFL
eukprot:Tbor_TRINITY_DN5912_c0_g7::TRINITY_DN5912_c0_g7_i2::g.18720::m.18720